MIEEGAPHAGSAPAAQVNGLSFRTRAWGPTDGDPVLLLHGFPEDADTWALIAAALADAGFRAIAFDQRGYSPGARPSDLAAYNFDGFVSDALGVADHFGLRTFHVAGLGMGGAQAWMLAAWHPDRVRSLVSLRFPHPAAFAGGITHEPAQREAWAKLQADLGGARGLRERADGMLADDAAGLRAFLARSGLPAAHLDLYVRRLQTPGALMGAMAWEHAASPAVFARVPKVAAPTLYLWSPGPALAEATVAATAAYATGDYQVEELPAAGNFMIETSPGEVTAAMLRFYRRLAA